LGHSCFRLKGKETVIITDPYHPDLGYSLGRHTAQIVSISHNHPGHSYAQGISQPHKLITGPGEYEIADVLITGIASYHDNQQGRERGKNNIYLLEIDGLRVCHLGDLGHLLTGDQRAEIGNVEVLLVPVGGVSTIDAAAALETAKLLNPKVIIPMHYKTEVLPMQLEEVEAFLNGWGGEEIAPQPKLSLTKSNLPQQTRLVLLNYSHPSHKQS
jgi:L-ascorbate metabolism protein UlaG (beta-lactamase superfamily)